MREKNYMQHNSYSKGLLLVTEVHVKALYLQSLSS